MKRSAIPLVHKPVAHKTIGSKRYEWQRRQDEYYRETTASSIGSIPCSLHGIGNVSLRLTLQFHFNQQYVLTVLNEVEMLVTVAERNMLGHESMRKCRTFCARAF